MTSTRAAPRMPDFFVVGAPRCGTTALCDLLSQHPDVFMSEPKEPQFFAPDLQAPWAVSDERAYRALFAGATEQRRAGEGSTCYLQSKVAATSIKAAADDAAIVIMLRNPVEMVYSLHAHAVYWGMEPLDRFEEALAAEDDRRAGRRLPYPVHSVEQVLYRDAALYSGQVRRYLETFGRKQVHVIVHDDFRADGTAVFRGLCAFLEIDDGFRPAVREVNANKEFRVPLAMKSRRLQTVARRAVPAVWRRRVLAMLSKEVARPPMRPETRRELRQFFREDVERLSELLDRDLTYWCAGE